MVTLARNLDVLGSRFLAGLTAVFIAGLREAPARKVGTFFLLVRCHHGSPFAILALSMVGRIAV
jgi:hypothetical protein